MVANKKELVGIWQNIAEVAAGWSDNYRFFENGEFIFCHSQMICDNREIDYSGTWTLEKQNSLKLIVKAKTILEGGKLVPSMGSCGSEYEIEGGEYKTIKLMEFETFNIRMSAIMMDKENRDLKTRTFDNSRFWKLEEDPKKY
jgi:hypothetical protein